MAGRPQMRTQHSEVEPQPGEWTLGCPRASPPASPDPPLQHHLYIYTPSSLSITSFDTPEACWGCLCPWAPGACSLYTVRGCKSPGSITASTRTGSFSLSLNSIQSSLSLTLSLSLSLAVALSNTAANTKHPAIADSKLAPGLKKTHTDTYTQTVHNNGILMKAWSVKRECVCVSAWC